MTLLVVKFSLKGGAESLRNVPVVAGWRNIPQAVQTLETTIPMIPSDYNMIHQVYHVNLTLAVDEMHFGSRS